MTEQDNLFILAPGGQVVRDAGKGVAEQVTGAEPTDASIRAIEQRTGRPVHPVQKAVIRAQRALGSQLAPASSAVVADIAENGTTPQNLAAAIPAVVTDLTLAGPRAHALAKGDGVRFEGLTAGTMAVVHIVRQVHDQVVLRNGGQDEVYQLPTEGMKRVGRTVQRVRQEAISRIQGRKKNTANL